MDVGFILVFAIAFLCAYYFLYKSKNLPPGPLCLPFLGSVGVMRQVKRKRPYLVMYDLGKEYGPVCSFKLGKSQFVVLTGYDVIHEALVKRADVLSDRPRGELLESLTKNGAGVILNHYNHNWKILRRFTLQALRDFGVGKTSLEEKIATEIDAISKRFIDLEDKPIAIGSCMQMIVGNVIYGIVFGVRYEYDDPEFDKVRLLTNTALTGDGAFNLSTFLPGPLVKLLTMVSRQVTNEERVSNFKKIADFIEESVAQHEATFDENVIRDFIDLQIKTSRDHESEEKTEFTRGNLLRVINDLFLAGAETTSTSLDWVFLYMAEYPDVQKKCQDEIEEVFGDKHILYADREKLPYLNATLMEIQRMTVIVPLSVAHRVRVDTEFRGYTIPAKTTILPNLYSACMDPKYWDKPEIFNPDRFLDENRKLIKVDAFIPFSTGPRQCLGEPLAKMELFLIFSNLVQRFSFRRENAEVKHSMKSKHFHATNTPEPYKLRVKSRK